MKELDISHNKAVGETPHFFTTILTDPSSVIEKLYFFYNNYSSTSWATELFSSLKENKTVMLLRIEGNNISDDVCEALTANNTLEVLYMTENPFTEQASQLILDSLKDNDALEKLTLPRYLEYVTKAITLQQQVVNEKRRRRGCDVKLEIRFH